MAINIYNYKLYEHVINNINNVFDGAEHQLRLMEEIILYEFLRNSTGSKKVNIKKLEEDLTGENIIKEVSEIFGLITKERVKIFKDTMKKALSSFKLSSEDETVDYEIIGDKAIIGDFTFKLNDKFNAIIKEFGEKKVINYIGNNLLWIIPDNYNIECNILKPLLYKYDIHNFSPSNIFSYNRYLYDGKYSSINGDKEFGSVGDIVEMKSLDQNWFIYIPPNYNIFSKIVKLISETKNKTFILLLYTKYSHLLDNTEIAKYKKEELKLDETPIFIYSIFQNYKKGFLGKYFKYILIQT